MSKRTLALAALIVLAALSRLLPHPPNFAAITAMAVFGGMTYTNRRTAVSTPLLALLFSDLVREVLYRNGIVADWGLYGNMWIVYGTTALIALLASFARNSSSPTVIALTTLGGSCLFFLVTNFAEWAGGSMYPHTPEGLAMCYTAALPFFRNALLGDLTYAAILFGIWSLAESRFAALRPTPTLANS